MNDVLVPVPGGLVERLVSVAQQHFARQVRWVDERKVDTIELLELYVADLERRRVMPTPSAEPGDLLVKLGRAETWTFTVQGWRELAPVELVTEERYAGNVGADYGTEPPMFTNFEPPGRLRNLGGVRGPLDGMGSGAASAKASAPPPFAGVSTGAGCISEQGTIPPPGRPELPALAQETLDEILELQQALDIVIDACEKPDLGVDDRLSAFRDGLQHARIIILSVAHKHARQQGVG